MQKGIPILVTALILWNNACHNHREKDVCWLILSSNLIYGHLVLCQKGSKSLWQQDSMAEDNWTYDQGQVLVKEKW